MADFLRNVVVISAVLSLLLLAGGCTVGSANEKAASGGLALPDASKDSEQPPALPSDDEPSSPPALPSDGSSSSGGVQLFG